MQALTNIQADAIMDVVDQCRAVASAHEAVHFHALRIGQFPSHRSNQRGVEKGTDYKHSVEVLADYYLRAHQLGVQDSILDGVLHKNLPSAVVVPLSGDTQEIEQIEGD